MMHFLVNSCKKTAELVDKQFVTDLTAVEKIQLKLHRIVCTCVICANYEKHSKAIDSLIEEHIAKKADPKTNKLSVEVKEKIIDTIKN